MQEESMPIQMQHCSELSQLYHRQQTSSGIDTGATIYNSTDEKLQTWNGEEWMDIGGGSEPDGSSADKAASSAAPY